MLLVKKKFLFFLFRLELSCVWTTKAPDDNCTKKIIRFNKENYTMDKNKLFGRPCVKLGPSKLDALIDNIFFLIFIFHLKSGA